MIKKAKLDWLDVEELAATILECSEPWESDEIEEALYDKFNISFDDFHKILELLVPLCRQGISPITGTKYRGFAKDDFFIVKEEDND